MNEPGSPGFRVSLPRFNSASATMYTLSLELKDSLDWLRQGLDAMISGRGEGPPWGTDEVGVEFGKQYTDTACTAFVAIGSYVEQVADGASKLATASDRYRRLDDFGAVNLAELRRSLG
jgi:hypothetical protein